MNKMRICFLLAALFLLTLLPWNVTATENVTGGALSETATWEYCDGTLTVSGTGYMDLTYHAEPPWADFRTTITKVVLAEGILDVGYDAFRDCEKLTQVVLPSTLKVIGYHAFRNCQSLESVNIPEGVTEIGSCAFKNCVSLKTVTIPNSVETLLPGAFQGCSNLESITLSKKLTIIAGSCFRDCVGLRSITLPESVTHIREMAFMNCEELAEVQILGQLSVIEEHAFQQCEALRTLELPASLREIGTEAFEGCRRLKELHFAGDAPVLGEGALCLKKTDDSLCTIYYPEKNATWTQEKLDEIQDKTDSNILCKPYAVAGCDHVQVVISGEDPTCTEAGLTEGKYCNLCGEVLKKQKTIDALGHDPVTVTVPPTCTEGGYDLHTCSRCGETTRNNEIAALGHAFGEWETVKEPTVETTGLALRKCAHCLLSEDRVLERLPPAPTEPPTQPPTAPSVQPPVKPPATAPSEAASMPVQPTPPEPRERMEAGLRILLILLAVAAAIAAVKLLTRKKL